MNLQESHLTVSSKHVRNVAQSGSALVWGTRSRKFESCHSDHTLKALLRKGFFCAIAIEATKTTAVEATKTTAVGATKIISAKPNLSQYVVQSLDCRKVYVRLTRILMCYL